jgi:ubiquinone biosynthesis protein UbiJ
MLNTLLVRALNHLIGGEPWAGERLRAFAGKTVTIAGGPFPMHLAVTADGLFAVADVAGELESEAAVTITLPADFAARLLVDRSSLFAAAKLAGSADFAETLAFVFRNLRWDAEDDLAQWVGDIAARRLVQAGKSLHARQTQAVSNLAANVAEYATEDADWLAPPRELQAFGEAVNALRDDVARLEKRLQRLA